jgi:hypothetical protein
MKPYVGRGTGERGAVLIQVAIAILVLTAFTAFVLDYGVLWVARNQAQNAADAGALAGAIARAYDDLANPPVSGGKADLSARRAALCASGSATCPSTSPFPNPVWPGQAGKSSGVDVTWTCPSGLTGRCVRVDVYRDGTHASDPVPTYFGPLLRMASQNVRATATARVWNANAADCMRPFSVADRWVESMGPTGQYDHYAPPPNPTGAVITPGTPDQYNPPNATSAGSGYRVPNDVGVRVTLKVSNSPGNAQTSYDDEQITQSWSLPLRLPDGNGGYLGGANDYRDSISGCKAGTVAIDDYLSLETGEVAGPTRQGVAGPMPGGDLSLTDQDPDAEFNTSTNTIDDSCAPGACPSNPRGTTVTLATSPRIVPIAVFDIDEFQWRRATGKWTDQYRDSNGVLHPPTGPLTCPGAGSKCVRVVNILGFFVEDAVGNPSPTITGRIMTAPGKFLAGAPGVGGGAAFLTAIQLVR